MVPSCFSPILTQPTSLFIKTPSQQLPQEQKKLTKSIYIYPITYQYTFPFFQTPPYLSPTRLARSPPNFPPSSFKPTTTHPPTHSSLSLSDSARFLLIIASLLSCPLNAVNPDLSTLTIDLTGAANLHNPVSPTVIDFISTALVASCQ